MDILSDHLTTEAIAGTFSLFYWIGLIPAGVIAAIDITRNLAVVKVILDYPDSHITDYMSLIKINGDWRIINKTFLVEPKTRR